jgi:hypothetical protein
MSAYLDEGLEEDEVADGDNQLINSLINDQAVNFEDLVFERDIPQVDQIELFCNYYTRHLEKAKFKDIRRFMEFQIFEMACVCAWESVSSSGQPFKNDVKWGVLVTHFDNILNNYPLKAWWRGSIIKYLPAQKIPDGVFEIVNEYRSTVTISATWKKRHKAKICGSTEPEIRVLHFGYKIEDTAKKAISGIGMHYNKLYRSPAELPSGTNSTSHLYLAMKNCLFPVERKVVYLQRRKRQFYREVKAAEEEGKGSSEEKPKLSKVYLLDGYEKWLEKEKAGIVMDDYFPKHWLTFHMCSLPINDRFGEGVYVSYN